jgi:pimeloyl-ACP methyl ester carboxylesterase
MTKQRVVRFGTVTPLAGILTEPVGGAPRDRPAVIILNSGILHHVGANRLHVQLARRLAELGFATLRFDFSGLGDSEPRRDSRPFEESGPLETREAIDYVSRTVGSPSAILMGLCSGADAAHLAALDDERVSGLGLLDPWAYRTTRYYAHYYGYRLVRPAMYLRWVRVRLGRLKNVVQPTPASDEPDPGMYDMPEYIRVFPPREKVAGELREFMRRGVELNVIFSGGLEEYNHQGQYRASFPEIDFSHRLEETHISGATHVFTALAHQERVVKVLSGWADRRFGNRAALMTSVAVSGARVG